MRNFSESYDDIFPVSDEQFDFLIKTAENYPKPAKFLHIGSNTGNLDLALAKNGFDVTGTEMLQDLLNSATLKRRTQLLSVRFFKLSISEVTKYLGKGFYNIIMNFDSRIPLGNDRSKLQKFFCNIKQLISKEGKLILVLYNYDFFKKTGRNPAPIHTIRETFLTVFDFFENGDAFVSQKIKYDEKQDFTIMQKVPFYPISKKEIQEFSRQAGFSSVEFYGSFAKEPLAEDAERMICIIS